LAVSRLESLALEEADEADLHAVCTSVPVRLAPLAVREERSIEVTGSEGPVLVRGDPGALEQAVRNLVENAIRYSARRTTVTIEIGADASIRVIDHGRGIPAELRNTVFERFQRADRRAGGAGLGLSIVRRTVEGHDGSIEVGEAPGGGTVFTMRLPPMNPRLL
jgi:signal transduction histidine kinase